MNNRTYQESMNDIVIAIQTIKNKELNHDPLLLSDVVVEHVILKKDEKPSPEHKALLLALITDEKTFDKLYPNTKMVVLSAVRQLNYHESVELPKSIGDQLATAYILPLHEDKQNIWFKHLSKYFGGDWAGRFETIFRTARGDRGLKGEMIFFEPRFLPEELAASQTEALAMAIIEDERFKKGIVYLGVQLARLTNQMRFELAMLYPKIAERVLAKPALQGLVGFTEYQVNECKRVIAEAEAKQLEMVNEKTAATCDSVEEVIESISINLVPLLEKSKMKFTCASEGLTKAIYNKDHQATSGLSIFGNLANKISAYEKVIKVLQGQTDIKLNEKEIMFLNKGTLGRILHANHQHLPDTLQALVTMETKVASEKKQVGIQRMRPVGSLNSH